MSSANEPDLYAGSAVVSIIRQRLRELVWQLTGQAPWLTAYIPNAMFGDQRPPSTSAPIDDVGRERLPGWGEEVPKQMSMRGTLLGLALVALEDLKDEELLLNYRCEGGAIFWLIFDVFGNQVWVIQWCSTARNLGTL